MSLNKNNFAGGIPDTPLPKLGADAPDTPMMRQYLAAKQRWPRHLLFFRMGDFYELFFEDAKIVSRVLGLTLTSRSKGADAVPMAGVPVHAVEQYLARLLRQGFSVSVCDQTEDPSQTKKLVRREVTRVVTPGTVLEENLMEADRPNRLAVVLPERAASWYAAPADRRNAAGKRQAGGSNTADKPANPRFGLASVDLSGGEIFVQEPVGAAALSSELARLSPSEILFPEPAAGTKTEPLPVPAEEEGAARRALKSAAFEPREAHGRLLRRFGKGLTVGKRAPRKGDALAALLRRLPLGCAAAGALVGYLEETHVGGELRLLPPQPFDPEKHLLLSATALRALEIVETIRRRSFEGSLLWSLDRTCTGAGARCLREWVLRPLREPAAIRQRQDAVAALVEDPNLRSDLRALLRGTADLERIAARLVAGRATPRDLTTLSATVLQLPRLSALFEHLPRENLLPKKAAQPAGLASLGKRISAVLRDDCPNALDKGGLIRTGVSAELDQVRSVSAGGKEWIAALQAEEARRTGISSLKIGYNRVFGYYIEVTKTHKDAVPDDYERRQTLTNAERYVTPALKEREAEVLGAEDRSRELERQLFEELRRECTGYAEALAAAGRALAELDTLASLAETAAKRGHVRPTITSTHRLYFSQLRHPVLEETLPRGELVPNDLELDVVPEGKPPQILIITGPNMAGKSTYIRAAALAVVMAQTGAFVPAEKAEVGIVDRVLTRVGAADDLSAGRSTFMVEMGETAEILDTAGPRSLLILDEVGRGTGTYDGVSLAWALLEHLHNGPVKPRTLFATHYHELCTLAEELSRLAVAAATVKEWQGEITFLHRIVPGVSERSFGLHVARLAGLPPSLLERAKHILFELETETEERVEHITEGGASVGGQNDDGHKPKRRHRKRAQLIPSAVDGQLLLFEPKDFVEVPESSPGA